MVRPSGSALAKVPRRPTTQDPAESAVAAAFDRLAPRYDDLCAGVIFSWMRGRVHARCRELFPAGARVLELGCGSGIDSEFLSANGVSVVAADPAPGMLAAAAARIAGGGAAAPVRFVMAGAESAETALAAAGEHAMFDGVLSDFGALNCVDDLRRLRTLLLNRVKPGGRILLCLMARVCPLEMLYFLVRAKPRLAFRRFSSPAVVAVEGIPVPTYYHTAADVARAFGSSFLLQRTEGLAVAVPPPWLESRWLAVPERIRDLLARADERLGSLPVFNRVGDHVLLEFVRR